MLSVDIKVNGTWVSSLVARNTGASLLEGKHDYAYAYRNGGDARLGIYEDFDRSEGIEKLVGNILCQISEENKETEC